MIELRRSQIFDEWLRKLKSDVAVAHITNRLTAAEAGNFGDCKVIGEGVSEMRIHHGPGYRVYFMREGKTVYLLLCGGNKSSQPRDIKKALAMAKEIRG
jgi:putative addiction module killer protein